MALRPHLEGTESHLSYPFPWLGEGPSHDLRAGVPHPLFTASISPGMSLASSHTFGDSVPPHVPRPPTQPWWAGRRAGQGWAQHQSHKLPITSVPQDKIPSKYSKRKSRVQVCSQEPCLQQQNSRDVQAMEKLQTEAPHQGNTLEPQAGGPGELVLAAGAQLQALRTSMLSKGTEHRACAEGNLKIHKSAFLASSCKLSVNVLKATSPRSQEAETSVVLHSDHHLVVSPRGQPQVPGGASRTES